MKHKNKIKRRRRKENSNLPQLVRVCLFSSFEKYERGGKFSGGEWRKETGRAFKLKYGKLMAFH